MHCIATIMFFNIMKVYTSIYLVYFDHFLSRQPQCMPSCMHLHSHYNWPSLNLVLGMIHLFVSGSEINYNKFIFFTGQDRLSGILPKNQTVYTLAVSHPEDKAYNHPEHAYNGITSPYSNIDSCFRTFNSRSWWYIYYPYIVYVYAIRVYYCHEFKSGLCKYR